MSRNDHIRCKKKKRVRGQKIQSLKLKLQSEKIYNNKMKLQMRIQILELKVKLERLN